MKPERIIDHQQIDWTIKKALRERFFTQRSISKQPTEEGLSTYYDDFFEFGNEYGLVVARFNDNLDGTAANRNGTISFEQIDAEVNQQWDDPVKPLIAPGDNDPVPPEIQQIIQDDLKKLYPKVDSAQEGEEPV